LLVSACSSPPEPEPPFPGSRQAPVSPPPSQLQPAPAPDLGPPKDACGATAVKKLIGRPRTEVPVALDPDKQRVACTTCPVTQDYRPDRLNFFFDAGTGLIREIRCG
jgi:hypothetical protein